MGRPPPKLFDPGGPPWAKPAHAYAGARAQALTPKPERERQGNEAKESERKALFIAYYGLPFRLPLRGTLCLRALSLSPNSQPVADFSLSTAQGYSLSVCTLHPSPQNCRGGSEVSGAVSNPQPVADFVRA